MAGGWLFRRRRDEGQDPSPRDLAAADGGQNLEEGEGTGRTAARRKWFRGLGKARRGLAARLGQLFQRGRVGEEVFTELEEVLLGADVGVKTTTFLVERLRERSREENIRQAEALREWLKEEMQSLLAKPGPPGAEPAGQRPWVIMVVGVNGVGKTTSIGKLAARYRHEGKRVLLVAGDTFRAAAIEQLELWAERAGAEIVKHKSGASPAAVAFDGARASLARGADVMIIDTAGRLHTKSPLMEELRKVSRIVGREIPGAPHETLLVIDATTGQNAVSQARTFQQALPLSAVVLAKLDGSARGGVALAIAGELDIPIRYAGLGQEEDDLQEFSAEQFVSALFSERGEGGGSSSLSLDTVVEGQ